MANAHYKLLIRKNGKNLSKNAKKNHVVNMGIMKFRKVIVKCLEISVLQAHNFHLSYINANQVAI